MSRASQLVQAAPGMIFDYAGSSAPSGFLLCYGQAISRTAFARLFEVVGTTFGVGDGSTTFNLPDLRGRVIAGKDDMGGSAAGVLTVNLTGTTTAGSAVISGLSSTTGLAVGMAAIGSNIPAGRTIASIDSASQVTLNSGTSVLAGTAAVRFAIVDGATLGATGGNHVHTLTTPQMPAHNHSLGGSYNTNRTTGSGGGENILSQLAATNTGNTGGGQAHPNTPPTMILNKIIKT
jgi:microcystin-dependent protein